MKTAYAGIFLVALLTTQAAAFSQTEFHLQYGKHKNPFSAAAAQQTFVFTVQQAAGWKLGDSFFFIDYLNYDARDGFNDRDFYGEWYPTLSFGKLANKELRVGPIRDSTGSTSSERTKTRVRPSCWWYGVFEGAEALTRVV